MTEKFKEQARPSLVAQSAARLHHGTSDPAELLKDCEETKTVMFPKPCVLQHNNKQYAFLAGVQEIPAELADHWWLVQSGMKLHQKDGADAPPKVFGEMTERHLAFLQANGYPQKTVADCQKFFDGMNDKSKQEFVDECGKWNGSSDDESKSDSDDSPETEEENETGYEDGDKAETEMVAEPGAIKPTQTPVPTRRQRAREAAKAAAQAKADQAKAANPPTGEQTTDATTK